MASCGITGGRNYDHPVNSNGGPLQWSTESNYDVGAVIDIDTVITAHHKGHIEVKACPMATQDGQVARQSCFDSHPLEFVSDELYGAPKDVNYPGRAYLAPKDVTQTDASGKSLQYYLLSKFENTSIHCRALIEFNKSTKGVSGVLYKFKFKLPSDISGQVLLQWYYITGNSCTAEGYNNYPFPAGWESSAATCTNIPDDGIGVPEQFWNCGEVYVGNSVPTATPAPTPGSTPAPNPRETPAPTPGSTPAPTPRETPAPTPRETPSPTSGSTTVPTKASTIAPSGSNNDSICPTGYTGLVASETCSSFQHCVSGQTVGNVLPCPAGLLFDEELQGCNYSDAVLCNGSPPDGGPGSQCPAGFTGVVAVDDCTGFRHCLDGEFVSAKQSCSAGLLFDESTHSCNWSNAVTCGSKRNRRLRGAGI